MQQGHQYSAGRTCHVHGKGVPLLCAKVQGGLADGQAGGAQLPEEDASWRARDDRHAVPQLQQHSAHLQGDIQGIRDIQWDILQLLPALLVGSSL